MAEPIPAGVNQGPSLAGIGGGVCVGKEGGDPAFPGLAGIAHLPKHGSIGKIGCRRGVGHLSGTLDVFNPPHPASSRLLSQSASEDFCVCVGVPPSRGTSCARGSLDRSRGSASPACAMDIRKRQAGGVTVCVRFYPLHGLPTPLWMPLVHDIVL